MKLFHWIKIQAEAMIKDRGTPLPRKNNLLLSQHFSNVQKIVKQIKEAGDIIQMANQAQPIGNEDQTSKGYQTVIYHGMTRTAEKKTFIQTLPDGKINTWTEAIA